MKTSELNDYIKQYRELYKRYSKESEALEKILIPVFQEKFPKVCKNEETAAGWICDLGWRNKKEIFQILTNLESSNVFKD